MRAKSLVQAWLEVELEHNGKTLAEALRDLNAKLDSAHTHSRVREWEENRNGRGDRLPRKIRQYMGRVVVRHVIQDLKISSNKKIPSKTLNRFIDMMC